MKAFRSAIVAAPFALACGMSFAASAPPTVVVKSPDPQAYIEDIAPISLKDPAHPNLVLLWSVSNGTRTAPVQVLGFDKTQNAYVDDTAKVIAGKSPRILNPRNFSIIRLNKNPFPGIVIANQGLDQSPWPGSTDTLLQPTAAGQLVDTSANLPQTLAYTHDVTAAAIDKAGTVGRFFNNIYSAPNTAPYYITKSLNGAFKNGAAKLPPALHSTFQTYTSSLLADVTGDGLADLILGPETQNYWPSVYYKNPGDGDFSKVKPVSLPPSPLPNVNDKGPVILDIRPIHLSSPNYCDLLVVSTTSDYNGYAVQILINDGKGHFVDETAKRISGYKISFVNKSTTGAGAFWIKRALPVQVGKVQDIIIESAGNLAAPSAVLLNDGKGHFKATRVRSATAYAGFINIGDQPMIIQSGYGSITLLPFPSLK